jgi:hypothetical protein
MIKIFDLSWSWVLLRISAVTGEAESLLHHCEWPAGVLPAKPQKSRKVSFSSLKGHLEPDLLKAIDH